MRNEQGEEAFWTRLATLWNNLIYLLVAVRLIDIFPTSRRLDEAD